MACITTFAPMPAMATTQLARDVRSRGQSYVQHEEVPSCWPDSAGNRTPRLSWVVATDSDGRLYLRMKWS